MHRGGGALRLSLLTTVVAGVASAQSGAWTRVMTGQDPGEQPSLVYHSARARTIAIQGGVQHSAWELQGNNWVTLSPLAPVNGTNVYVWQAIYATQRQSVVYVAMNRALFEWHGTSWSSLGTLPGFSPVGAAAWDSARGVLVYLAHEVALMPTREWDGTNVFTITDGGVSPRTDPAMCYVPWRQRTMLFGGLTAVARNDTWEWDGVGWLQHQPAASPPPREGAAMVADVSRRIVLLYGGRDGSQYHRDLWSWDGLQWRAVTTIGPVPVGSNRARFVHDTARDRFVLYGGWPAVGYPVRETWELQLLGGQPASFATFGAGCAGSGGVPTLATRNNSVPRLGTTLQLRLASLGATPFHVPFGLIGLDDRQWNGLPLPLDLASFGMAGCRAWIAPEATHVLTNAGGQADWDIAVPPSPTLIGFDAFVQGAMLDPGINPAGLVVTNAGRARVGT